jgi:hypothetical protein
MATHGVNIMQYITNAAKQTSTAVGSAVSSVSSGTTQSISGLMGSFSSATPVMYSSTSSFQSVGQIASYVFAILIILLIISLFVHFFITPIYRFHPGAPGIISIPGFDDGKLFWNTSNVGQIKSVDLPIQNMVDGYSLIMDVFIENPLQFSRHPRIIFSRGAVLRETPTSDTLLGIFENYNLAIALLPDTNDMIVSVLNKDNNMENVIIPNVPVQEPFRIGVILMEQALEVYLNGYLMKTKTFHTAPKSVKGDIFPASGIEANMAKLRTLKIWPRLLTSAEMRDTQPSLTKASDFGAGPIPGTSTACAPPIAQH